jgi:hypothetical protein
MRTERCQKVLGSIDVANEYAEFRHQSDRWSPRLRVIGPARRVASTQRRVLMQHYVICPESQRCALALFAIGLAGISRMRPQPQQKINIMVGPTR